MIYSERFLNWSTEKDEIRVGQDSSSQCRPTECDSDEHEQKSKQPDRGNTTFASDPNVFLVLNEIFFWI